MIKKHYFLKYIISTIIAIAIVIAVIFGIKITKNNSLAATTKGNQLENISNSVTLNNMTEDSIIQIEAQKNNKDIDLENIVLKNQEYIITEKIERQEVDLEYTTQYRENNSLAKGKIQTLQEGNDGKQDAIVKKIYRNGELVSLEQISSEVKKVAVDKIVEIGTASFSSNYVPIMGDKLKVTSSSLAIRVTPDSNSEKIITIDKNSEVTLKDKQDGWYYISYESYIGWIPTDCVTYVDPNSGSDGDGNNIQYSKEQLSQDLGISMLLNKKSGLTLEQFRKILSNDTNDKEGVFTSIADYFYYVEQQYNINGIFVAAVGIHESGWGTSSISKNKKNLFGYGAYDRDPSGSAATFETYQEGVDLVSRVLVKYYINPIGTSIYSGETATGTYYKGSTLTAVNKTYASDTNWANAVYKWMMYLYNKL